MTLAAHTLYEVMEATWPPAKRYDDGPVILRDGAGGGKRVSAATVRRALTAEDLPDAEAAMARMGQAPLFMVHEGEETLDILLDAQGYTVVDPVNIYAAPVAALAAIPLARVTTFTIWDPLAMMRDIWAEGGIGPARVAVMERAQCARTGLFGRHDNRPAATGYVGLHKGIAMVHALETLPRHRRAGLGKQMMCRAAHWAADQGAAHITAICTRANEAANALYPSLGMTVVGSYDYRIKGAAPT